LREGGCGIVAAAADWLSWHLLESWRDNQTMKIVRVTVKGGVVQHVEIPEGVKVIIRDYDVDCSEDNQLQQDEDGDKYIESIWENE
jgi:hypothetical protein